MSELTVSAPAAPAKVQMTFGVKIPLRDGIHLNATLYLPRGQKTPGPALFTLTPYVAQSYHDRGVYFATHGYPFLTVDVRGRGNSEGEFRPLIQEARDGFDVVEWLARQPYCNGKVAMWGGSYGGYDQWATAKEFPPHLATIVPVASAYPGVDSPARNNLFKPYQVQWLTYITGHTAQDKMFADKDFWSGQFKDWFESGTPFKDVDSFVGNPLPIFQEWMKYPEQGPYWDQYTPRPEQHAKLDLPILTVTGIYDGDQPGALMYYREHMMYAPPSARAMHYLVIGPWDHAGTRTPQREFGGLKVGAASIVDLPKLHLQWYAWTMQGGPKPEFLQKKVAYYVTGAEKWRYADTLEAVTARTECLYLHSTVNPTDAFQSGSLVAESPDQKNKERSVDHYVYDPRDVSLAALETTVDPYNAVDQRPVHARAGKILVYHSAPFAADVEISGFFKFSAWIALDCPDTDFRVAVYEIALDGSSVLLTADIMRARYREGLRETKLIRTEEPLRYDFENFTFASRHIKQGHRLRLVIGPMNSIYAQKNYNSGGVVSEESMKDARPVTVRLFHDESRPSALYIPFGQS